MAALQLQALRAPAAAAAPLRSSSFCTPLSLPAPAPPRRGARASTASARITMRFGVASKQAYICRDCGYIYSDRTPFDKLPDKYFCPVCGAPKRRFKPYEPKVAKNANATDARKARKEQLKKDEAVG
jgi:rubredoxin